MTAAAGVRVQPGSAAHRAMIAELDAGLGPFEDPAWRADLSLLTDSVRATAVQWARDAQTIARLAAQVPRSPGDERGGTAWTSFVRELAVARQASDQATHAELALSLALVRRHPRTQLSRLLLTVAELRKACTAPHTGQLIDLADTVVRPG